MTRVGDLRDRFVFQERGLDDNGDRLGAWSNGFGRDAATTYLRGTEPVLQQRLQGVQPVVVTIREDELTRTITSGWRAVSQRGLTKGQIFNVNGVSASKTPGFLDVLAKRDGSNG